MFDENLIQGVNAAGGQHAGESSRWLMPLPRTPGLLRHQVHLGTTAVKSTRTVVIGLA